MTPEQWQQIKAVLHEALELSPGERGGRLASFYALQPHLRDEVESLLRSYDEVGGFLETPYTTGSPGTAHEDAGDGWIGRRMGAYELAERVGAGGMGVVFRAVRADGQYQKQVAIKVIHAAFGTEYFLSRFRNERQILASLDHPNIARLIDGGTTETGLPYVVMEYVDGVPIDEYCDSRSLSVTQRLQLFRVVCAAVQYAHERRVIHRDLKPGNILVSAEGVPKLLDFGIAKMLDPAGEGLPAQHSVALLQIMTPDFASPEQVRGLASSAATDVYSLGMILYWLLTGQPPYTASGAVPQEVVKAICETEPERPSVAVARSVSKEQPSSQQLRRTLAGDLDQIVLKALRKEPERRYSSVQELSEDIGRYLDGLAVRARRGTWYYRLTKFMGRHVAGVWAAALMVLACGFLYSVEVSNAALPVPNAAARASIIVVLLALLGAALLSWQFDSRGREGGSRVAWVILAAMLLAGGGVVWRFARGFSTNLIAFNPPAHSVAVMPFTNMSGDAGQEYFSDGLSEELINALSRIEEVQVVARTSSFSFRGKDLDVRTIGRRLNVGAVLEGSIRKSGNTVRVAAQLVDAVTGFRMWSQTYDRDLKDVLSAQTEVATAVTEQLQVKLLGNEAARIEVGGTHDTQAYDAYLRGMYLSSKAEWHEADNRAALAEFDRAIALDPSFSAAYARRTVALFAIAQTTHEASIRADLLQQARESADRSVRLAPDFSDAHLAAATACELRFDFVCAASEYERAVSLAPGSVHLLADYGYFFSMMGRHAPAIAAARRAARLDPQRYNSRLILVVTLQNARRFEEAVAAAREAAAVGPEQHDTAKLVASSYLGLNRFDAARQLCESSSTLLDDFVREWCLAIAYHALGKPSQAEAELQKFKTGYGDACAFWFATVYAQWGEKTAALNWLRTAERLHDPALELLRTFWALDPIRDEPDFKALERRLNFPS